MQEQLEHNKSGVESVVAAVAVEAFEAGPYDMLPS